MLKFLGRLLFLGLVAAAAYALWKKLAVAALIAVAETVVTSSVKGRKPK